MKVIYQKYIEVYQDDLKKNRKKSVLMVMWEMWEDFFLSYGQWRGWGGDSVIFFFLILAN